MRNSVGFNGTLRASLLPIHAAQLSVTRYFADNVRDDYAAGQLDAQVRPAISHTADLVHTILVLGGGSSSRNERIVYLRRELVHTFLGRSISEFHVFYTKPEYSTHVLRTSLQMRQAIEGKIILKFVIFALL